MRETQTKAKAKAKPTAKATAKAKTSKRWAETSKLKPGEALRQEDL